ncbi:MAG TPA: hypothetical protein VHV26_00465 [Rhizomicrobium sp.]|nr:hypothetical protein [Rhizomicrobium sp.]
MRFALLRISTLCLSAAFTVMAVPAICSPEIFRPGLWKIILPDGPPRDRCVFQDSVTNWIFNSDTWPPGACSEKIVSQNATEKVVNRICSEPSQKENPVTYNGTLHFRLVKPGTAVIDHYEYTQAYAVKQPSGVTRVFTSSPFRSAWVETDCGSAGFIRDFPPDLSGVGLDGLDAPRKVLR